MAIYFLLGTLTPEGQRRLQNNPDLVAEAAASLDIEGARVLGQYAVLGQYDFITMVLANENESVARLSAEFGARTGLHFQTLAGVASGFMADNDPSGGPSEQTSVGLSDDVGDD